MNLVGMLSLDELFKGRHFDREIIVLCVRWYLRYKLSFRDLVEMMAERGLSLAHTTIMRWIGIVNLKRVSDRPRVTSLGGASQSAAGIPATFRQAAKPRSRVARRSSAVAFSG